MSPAFAAIALGSNLGIRHDNCQQAIQQLAGTSGVRMLRVSSLHEYPALVLPEQEPGPDFLNAVCTLETELTPNELLECCLSIEKNMGRVRRTRWEARIIDLDILFYDDIVIQTKHLNLPHPFLHERRFVLEPLTEIMSGWVHPVLNKTALELLAQIK